MQVLSVCLDYQPIRHNLRQKLWQTVEFVKHTYKRFAIHVQQDILKTVVMC